MVLVLVLSSTQSSKAFSYEFKIQVTAPWPENKHVIKVSIINEANLNQDKIDLVKKVIQSNNYIINKDPHHLLFEGWSGALNAVDPIKAKKFDLSFTGKES